MSFPPGVPAQRPVRSGLPSFVRGGSNGGSFARSRAQLLAPGSFGASREKRACPSASGAMSGRIAATITKAINRRTKCAASTPLSLVGQIMLALSPRTGRWWVCVVVDGLVSNSLPLLVDESQRLLKQRRRWGGRRYGALEDIQAVFVQMNRNECIRPIVVGELQPPSFNEVRPVVRVEGHPRVPLENELRCCIIHCAA